MGAKFRGIQQAKAGFRKMKAGAAATADKAAGDYADTVYDESQRIVPRETNALARSGRIVHNGPGNWSVWYGWSAVDAPGTVDYAAAVHERLDQKHAPPTQAKFLESPLFGLIGEFRIDCANEFRKLVKRSF